MCSFILRYCVLLITGEDETFVSVNDAFFDFAASNTKEVVRFAYVYQRQQQPLCDALLKTQDVRPPQVNHANTCTHCRCGVYSEFRLIMRIYILFKLHLCMHLTGDHSGETKRSR